MYSALKVNGKKLYELAREASRSSGRPARCTFTRSASGSEASLVRMEVTCSKGTYIRTLCHDIGEKLAATDVWSS